MSAAGSTNLIQRLLEALISIPFLVLALLAIASAGPELSGNPVLVVLVVALVYAPRIARMARAAAIDIATRDFVTVARLRGESAWSVMRRELLPNATSVLLVEFALRAGYAPVLIGSLGFLGFGLRPPTPEWGLMISENRALLIDLADHRARPGLALASLVVGLNLFTEGLARILGRTVKLGGAMTRAGHPRRGRTCRSPIARAMAGCASCDDVELHDRAAARCSAWSASPAAASRPSACSFSAIAIPPCGVEGGAGAVQGPRPARARAAASSTGCAATASASCRRTRRRRSTPACASARRSPRRCCCTSAQRPRAGG